MAEFVMFDFYGTLAGFHPGREVIQKRAAGEFGLHLTDEGVSRGYKQAEEFMTSENAKSPLRLKSDAERLDFFARFEQMVLEGDGYAADYNLARKIWMKVQSQEYRMVLFPDVVPGLEALKSAGFRTAIITNMTSTGEQIRKEFGLESLTEFVLTSQDAKAEKPHPAIFCKALELAQVQPADAVYVGDQIKSDIHGADAAGMTPILMDRYELHPDYIDHPRATDMKGLFALMSDVTP